jgi:hypothetical protein
MFVATPFRAWVKAKKNGGFSPEAFSSVKWFLLFVIERSARLPERQCRQEVGIP